MLPACLPQPLAAAAAAASAALEQQPGSALALSAQGCCRVLSGQLEDAATSALQAVAQAAGGVGGGLQGELTPAELNHLLDSLIMLTKELHSRGATARWVVWLCPSSCRVPWLPVWSCVCPVAACVVMCVPWLPGYLCVVMFAAC